MRITNPKVYAPFWQAARRPDIMYLVLRGGAGSGKSYSVSQLVAARTMIPGTKQLCVRRVGNTLRDSCFQDVVDRLTEWGIPHHTTYVPLKITNLQTGCEVLFRGLDKVDKLKSISGITHLWLEEAAEPGITAKDLSMIEDRVRGKPPKSWPANICISFNPTSQNNWLYKKFFDGPPESLKAKTFYSHTTYKDVARFLPAHLLELYDAKLENDPQWARVYGRGEWGMAEGLVYPAFLTAPERPRNPSSTYFGVDFGYNAPAAIVRVEEYDGLYYLSEVLYSREMLNSDLIAALKQAGGNGSHTVYLDSAEPDRIEEFRQAGFHMAKPAQKGPGSIRSGIDKVKEIHPSIRLVEGQCPNIQIEQQGYQWETQANGEAADKPLAKADHALDALRYALVEHNRGHIEILHHYGY